MAFGDPPTSDFQLRPPWADPLPSPLGQDDTQEQWLFQFHEHMLLTVQAINRLRQAVSEKML
jgi:hypothetical protein